MNWKLITANINSLSKTKKAEIDLLLKDKLPTALLVQETCLPGSNNKFNFNKEYDYIGNNEGRGTGIFLGNNISFSQAFFFNNTISAIEVRDRWL